MPVTLTINGDEHVLDVAPETPLLWVLRDHLGLTGTKYGCGVAQCGACMVDIDGAPSLACITPVEAAQGLPVTTIEARSGPVADAVREAWVAIDTPQCGYCQAGQIMSAVALLEQNPDPSDDDIDAAMRGNLCRCATYMRIRRAIKDAATRL